MIESIYKQRKGGLFLKEVIVFIAVFVIISIAAAEDIKMYKVHNGVYVAGWIVAFFLQLFRDGGTGVLSWSGGCVLPVLILIPVFLLGGIGGADVKAFSVIGAFCGINEGVCIIVLSFIVAAIFSAIKFMGSGKAVLYIRWLADSARQIIAGNTDGIVNLHDVGVTKIHFVICIWMAVIIFKIAMS